MSPQCVACETSNGVKILVAHFFHFLRTCFVIHVQWMVLGMSGPPGACAHPHAAVVTVIVPAHASCPRMEESLAAAPQNKPSSATSLFAQVSQGFSLLTCICGFTM